MTATEGPVDNYLSAEEEAYFKSGGKNENEFKYSNEGSAETLSDSEELSNADDDVILFLNIRYSFVGQELL